MKIALTRPATEWKEGLPIGTGRLAAMALGELPRARLALNHEGLWKGTHRHRDNKDCASSLPEVRRLLLAGRYEEGARLANEAFGGTGGISGKPNRVDPYQPAGDLFLEFPAGAVRDYSRELDLDTGRALVRGTLAERRLRIHYLAHLKEDRILARITADGDPFDVDARLDRIADPDCALRFDSTPERLQMDGRFDSGLEFRVRVDATHREGRARATDNHGLRFEGVTEVVLEINIGVRTTAHSAEEECDSPLHRSGATWDARRQAHEQEFRRARGELKLELDLETPTIPLEERLRRLRAGTADPTLPLLYFEYGRYLLLSASSPCAMLPANLQGKWNEELKPPWQADYHHDINLQMNYWFAETAGMANCIEPLLRHIERFVPHARKAAHDLYGCRGVLFPLQTDPWGRATPEAFGWAVWIGAAAWLAQHVWWRYEYSLDRDFLANRAYPFFKEVAAFYEDYLIPDANGTLQIVPSQSPENRFVGGGKLPVSLGVSSTMDVLLAQDAFDYAIRASELLNTDAERRALWQRMKDRLPPLKIGRHGQLQEWNEDFEEVEPAHRHVSHLMGVHPGDRLHPERTPELWHAAEISLERRLAAGGGHTGWSRAWTACLFARLGRGEDAWVHLIHLITDFATDSLLDLHPPRIFQIDGNFGGAAAVLEMLLQGDGEELRLLPALPKAWPSGRVSGLRARGGFTVGMEWRNGRLVRATLTGLETRPCTLVNPPPGYRIETGDGQPVSVRTNGRRLTFDLHPHTQYTVRPNERLES